VLVDVLGMLELHIAPLAVSTDRFCSRSKIQNKHVLNKHVPYTDVVTTLIAEITRGRREVDMPK
jgi:hypothetical protein